MNLFSLENTQASQHEKNKWKKKKIDAPIKFKDEFALVEDKVIQAV